MSSDKRTQVGLKERAHSKLIRVQALMTIETGEKKSLEEVVEHLAEKYIKEREK